MPMPEAAVPPNRCFRALHCSNGRRRMCGLGPERNIRSAVVARLQPRVLVRVKRCERTWCAVDVPEYDLQGYVRQVKLWGVYPDEPVGRARRQLFNPIKRTE
ncbi:hypothetical protein IC232_27065 [Microvirga sp. BT688]|uniref:SH3 domain-containing protein n=1 Tax=Microvirga sp. TaxID=1873136 RepID=UPI001682809D|nr:SH3 domain-containing protein [Microvirga sp.]MBD2750324.1 hypothetical protein [Microvirga sp.]